MPACCRSSTRCAPALPSCSGASPQPTRDSNPNGSVANIAGLCNEARNVVGLMPHPEHAVEALTGAGTDGLGFFTSLARYASTINT